jgi:hypothetical protein
MNEIARNENPSTPVPIVKYSEVWWATRSPEVRARRCTGHKKNGDQCGKVAMEAQKVCGTHGGRAPQAKRKARERLEEAADRMGRLLLGIAESADSETVKLAAVKDALDRAGLKPPTQVQVSEKPLEPWEELIEYATQPLQPKILQITKAEHEAMKRGEVLAPPLGLPPAGESPNAELVLMPHAVPPDSAGARCDGDQPTEDRQPPSASPRALPNGAIGASEDATAELADGSLAARVAQARQRRLATANKDAVEEQTGMC